MVFLSETLQRLKERSPKFFKVWNTFNSILLVVAGLPVILTQFGVTDLNILPAYVLKIITFASAWGLFMNKLTVQSTPIGVTPGKTVLKVTDESKLPFTAANEQKIAIKENIPLVVVNTSNQL